MALKTITKFIMFKTIKFIIKFIAVLVLLILTIVATDMFVNKDKHKDNFDNILKTSDAVIIVYYDNGNVKAKMPLKNGIKDGVAYSYYKDGSKRSEMTYVNNKLNGLQKLWYQNGKLKTIETVVNNKRDGLSKDYFESGVLAIEVMYKDGDSISFTEYTKEGNIEYKSKKGD